MNLLQVRKEPQGTCDCCGQSEAEVYVYMHYSLHTEIIICQNCRGVKKTKKVAFRRIYPVKELGKKFIECNVQTCKYKMQREGAWKNGLYIKDADFILDVDGGLVTDVHTYEFIEAIPSEDLMILVHCLAEKRYTLIDKRLFEPSKKDWKTVFFPFNGKKTNT